MSLVETLLILSPFAHLMFSGRLSIRCVHRVIMIILFIYQRQSKFLRVKEDQKHEILEYHCCLSGAICTTTKNVTNNDHTAHETRHNEIFMDARTKRSSCICGRLLVRWLRHSHWRWRLRVLEAWSDVTPTRSPALHTWFKQYSTSISSHLHLYLPTPIQHEHAQLTQGG